MAKTEHLNPSSNINLPSPNDHSLGKPVEELKKKDYSALSTILLRKGEFYLLQGSKEGLEYFDMAAKLDPANSALFLKQGLTLFEYGSHEGREEGLTLASKQLKMATTLSPESFEAWHLWGNTLYFLGVRKNEPSYFHHALQKYEKALTLIQGHPADIVADLYWDLGDVWSKLAEMSQEVTDYSYAIKAYEKAATLQDGLASEFWINYGNMYLLLGNKTNDLRFFVKAVNCFKNAVTISLASSEAWFFLGKTLYLLYSFTHDEDHFSQANECFSTAAQLQTNSVKIWLEWGRLLLESGVICKDEKKLRAAIDKCYKAHQCKKKNPYVIATWAEALAFLGSYTERLDLIHEALNKIESALKRLEDPDILYAHGICISALAYYYKDIDYYYQAIERFQEGLSMNRSHDRLWYAIGSASFGAAVLDHDEISFERACHFFERALNLKKQSIYHSHYAKCLLMFGEMNGQQKTFELAVYHFEEAMNMQKNAIYLHPDWIFYYASALDQLAGFLESDTHYLKALDLLNHILIAKPDFPKLHHQLAITYSHYGELVNEPEIYYRSLHHFRLAYQRDKENDLILLDWALTLLNVGDLLENDIDSDHFFREAEYKMIQAAKLGNVHAYYALSCLYSLIGDLENSLRFFHKAKNFEALPSIEDILEDAYLENLRETPEFQSIIQEISEKK